MAYGLPSLLQFTSSIISWCKDILFQCLGFFSIAWFSFVWLGVTIAGGGLLYGLTRGIWELIKTHQAVKRLPMLDYGRGVILIKDNTIQVAFTHGLFRPRVYISSGLIKGLTRSELNAVVLHELHHKRNKDPLRFFLLSILKDTFFYLPIWHYIFKSLHEIREKMADDMAVFTTKEPVALASAIVKVARSGRLAIEPVSIRGGMLEARVKRLIEGKDEGIKPPSMKSVVASLVMGGLLFVVLALPIWASPWVYNPERCDMGHCAAHIENVMGEGCMTHCMSH